MPNVLFAGEKHSWPDYRRHLDRAFAELGLVVDLRTEFHDPADVQYVIYSPSSGLADFTPFTGLKAVLSLWAGVETIATNPTIRVPLCRMVDSGLTEGMVEWVTGHVLRHHLGIDEFVLRQDGTWRHDMIPPLARERRVGILGLGELGAACAVALRGLNFDVSGWSRRAKRLDGITCLSGDDGLKEILRTSRILVLLLPLTPETENIIDRHRIALLPDGAVILNPGRGALIDDEALLQALDDGKLGHATLDVFREEPLPAGHRFWSHPGVTVTPHIASDTRAASASQIIARNVARGERGEPFLFPVDRQRGY
ncbi:MAG: 2-hydroxyacid dehydrogenase [Paracoccaceae bacterium]